MGVVNIIIQNQNSFLYAGNALFGIPRGPWIANLTVAVFSACSSKPAFTKPIEGFG